MTPVLMDSIWQLQSAAISSAAITILPLVYVYGVLSAMPRKNSLLTT